MLRPFPLYRPLIGTRSRTHLRPRSTATPTTPQAASWPRRDYTSCQPRAIEYLFYSVNTYHPTMTTDPEAQHVLPSPDVIPAKVSIEHLQLRDLVSQWPSSRLVSPPCSIPNHLRLFTASSVFFGGQMPHHQPFAHRRGRLQSTRQRPHPF